MHMSDLAVGQWFVLECGCGPWEYRGNGWFGKPYSGGPYHTYENPVVYLAGTPEANNALACDQERANAT